MRGMDPRTGSNPGKLQYFGGPINPNVVVNPIFYGEADFQKEISAFYAAVVDSPHIDWLSEYNTPTQKIGRGSFGKSYKETQNLKTNLDDVDDIQPYLIDLVKKGKITPSETAYFPIHFAPGISVTQGGQGSCEVFCAYHGTIDVSAISSTKYLYYGVLPDQGGGCAGGCGFAPTRFENLCSVSSHELIEMITDGAVGIGQTIAFPLAWYSPASGEIGDICNAQQGKVVGGDGKTYTVQTEWSNKYKKCIVTPAGLPIPTTATGKPGPTPTSSCAHDKCQTGPALDGSCDDCVAQVVASDSFCGDVYWDSGCVSEVGSICGISC